MSIPSSIKDRELQKFCETSLGETAVRVCIDDGAIGFIKSEIIIPANSTVVADTNLLTSFSRLDYIMNFKDVPTTVTKSMKMVVQNNAGQLTSIISERMGGSINVLLVATDDAVDAFLEVSNNEAFDLTMTFLKSKI